MPLLKLEDKNFDFDPDVDMYLPGSIAKREFNSVFAAVSKGAHIVLLSHDKVAAALVPFHPKKDALEKDNVFSMGAVEFRKQFASACAQTERGEFVVVNKHAKPAGTLVSFPEYRKRLKAHNRKLGR